MNLDNVTPDLIQNYSADLAQGGSIATLKRRLSSLKKFFDWAESEGHVQANPFPKPTVPEPATKETSTKRSYPLFSIFKWIILAAAPILSFALVSKLSLPIPFRIAPAIETTPSPQPEADRPVDETPIPTSPPTPDENILIEGSSITLKTSDATDGDIVFNPDGRGGAIFLFESPNGNNLSAQNANLSSGSLFYGLVGNNATGYNLLTLQSGSGAAPTTKFSVNAQGNTFIDGKLTVDNNLNITNGNLQIAGVTRFNSLGRLASITGYYQDSGLFEIDQGGPDFARITKSTTATADVLTLTLNETGKTASNYDTLVLNRTNANSTGYALDVRSGNVNIAQDLTVGDELNVNGSLTVMGTTIATTGNLETTGNLRVDGNATLGDAAGDTITINGQGLFTRVPSSAHTGTWAQGSGTWNVSDSTVYINPASSVGDGNLLGLAVAGSVKFSIDAEGDIFGKNLVLTGTTTTGTTTVVGDLSVEGNTTLGDTLSDTLTFNASTLAIPNSLNVDTNTLFIDASTDRLGIGDASPDAKLEVLATTEQLRLTHTDGTIDARFTLDGNGDLTIDGSSDGTGSETLTLTGFTTLASALTAFNCTDCIDFDDLEDTLDLDTALILNQTTNTWSQTFTGTTTTGYTYTASSLTGGTAALYTTAATAFTGSLVNVTSTGGNASNTGTLLRSSAAASDAVVPLMLTNLGTGNSFRINDETGDADTSPFLIDASGNVGIGTTTPDSNLHIVENISTNPRGILNDQYSADTGAPRFVSRKSRNATIDSHTIVQSGDILGNINFQGSDGTDFIEAAYIIGVSDGTPGTNDMPGRLVFATTADGGTAGTERMRIDSSGNVGIGTTPSYRLHVSRPSTDASGTTIYSQVEGVQSVAHTGTVIGFNSAPTYSAASGNTLANLFGTQSNPQNTSTGTVTSLIGGRYVAQNTSTGTVTNLIGVNSIPQNTSTGTVTSFYGVQGGPSNTAGGAVTTMIGLIAVPSNTSSGTIGTIYGAYGNPASAGSGAVTTLVGIQAIPQKTGTGAVTSAFGLHSRIDNSNATGAITNAYALYVAAPTETGTISNKYALVTEAGAGNAGIGTLTPGSKLEVENTASADDVLLLEDSSGLCEAQPTTTGLTWSCSSDSRLKTAFADPSSVLDYITNIPLKDYTVVATGERAMGPIAQELQKTNPELVRMGDDGYLQVSELTPWQIVKGIQELSTKIADLLVKGIKTTRIDVEELIASNKIVSPVIETSVISPVPNEKDIAIKIGNTNASESGQLLVKNKDEVTVASIDEDGNATFSGELKASNIYGQNIEEIQQILQKVDTNNQELLAASKTWEVTTASDSASFINLTVLKNTLLSDTLINGKLNVGALIFDNLNNSINAAGTLKLQDLALAPIEAMAGKFIIDTEGNVKIAGNIEVAGNIKTDKVIIAGDKEAMPSAQVIDNIVETNATAGTATIKVGLSEITIKNQNITNYTLVYVTPTSDTQNQVLYIKEKADGYFKVGFLNPIGTDTTFNWWVIDLE